MYLNNRNRPTAIIKAPYQRQRMKFAIEDKQEISILDWTFQTQTRGKLDTFVWPVRASPNAHKLLFRDLPRCFGGACGSSVIFTTYLLS